MDTALIAPSESRVLGHVDSIKPPRSFGRSSEVKIAFDHIVPLDVKMCIRDRCGRKVFAENLKRIKV